MPVWLISLLSTDSAVSIGATISVSRDWRNWTKRQCSHGDRQGKHLNGAALASVGEPQAARRPRHFGGYEEAFAIAVTRIRYGPRRLYAKPIPYAVESLWALWPSIEWTAAETAGAAAA